MLSLTSLGKQDAQNTTGRGPEFAVLSELYENDDSMEFEEITEKLHMDDEKASMIINKLIKTGRVKNDAGGE